MKIVRTKDFDKAVRKLPKDAQKLYRKQEVLFQEDWRDSRLHTKKLRGMPGFSFRVTRRYRVLFYFTQPGEAVFFDIGHRSTVYE